ncbi:MAG: hypothetical protein U5K37_05080 [Natrialbaceae archaeon]|nr:hypothetical protein [Natrialbaceae archaeon]
MAETTETDSDENPTRSELLARVDLLEQENRRLYKEYTRAHQSRYRQTAIGLAVVGGLALAGSLLFPAGREVLLALGATGIFAGLLTYFLTPGQFVPARVGTAVYEAWARNGDGLVDALGLRREFVYLPPGPDGRIRLFVPRYAEYELPVEHAGPIVIDEDRRGLIIEATGSQLVSTVTETLPGSLAAEPESLGEQLTDGLVEGLELVGRATADVDEDGGSITVAISGSAYGAVDRFDHPVASFLAGGVASALEQPVRLDVTAGDERADWLVTCHYDDN